MPIEITGQTSPYTSGASEGASVQVARNEPTAQEKETGRPSALDTVSLTETAALIQKLDEVIVTLPVVDTQRIEGIQKAIANGTYEVDPMKVAEKLIDFETTLQNRGGV